MAAEALLPSWRDTPTRAAIVGFVDEVTDEGGASFVHPAQRVAVFDNDGTLWSEKPIPIQLDFTLFRMAEMAESDAALGIGSLTGPPWNVTTDGSVRPWSSTTTVTMPTSVF